VSTEIKSNKQQQVAVEFSEEYIRRITMDELLMRRLLINDSNSKSPMAKD